MAKGKSFAERVKERAKEAEYRGGSDTIKMKDGITFYKPKKGKNEIIIVPFEMDVKKNSERVAVGDLWFRLQIDKHFNIGPEDKAVICPKTIGKKCPICEHRAALIAQGKATDDPEVKALAARKRELYYVIDLADDDQLKIYECSYHNFGRKLEEEIRESEDGSIVENFADPDNGAVITVRMTEESIGKNKYLAAARFDFQERDKNENKLVKEAMKDAAPFGELLTIMDYDELKMLFYDIAPDDESEDDDIDENPAPRKRAGKKAEPIEDDDSDESGQDSDEDEEDEPPMKRRPGRKADPEPEDDEEEPEEKPKRKNSRGKKAEPVEDDDSDESEKTKAPKCPGGGKYGKDCDELDECEDCPYWADCRDLTDEYKAEKRKKR